MQNGDISGVSAPRVLLVFEGFFAYLEPSKIKEWNKAVRREDWTGGLRLWTVNELALAKATLYCRQVDVNLEVITYQGPESFAEAIETYLQTDENVPIRRVLSSTPERTSRRATFASDIIAVYDSDPARFLTYGAKGRYMNTIHDLGR